MRIDAVGAAAGWWLKLLNLDQQQSGPCWPRSTRCCSKIQELRNLVSEPGAVDACVMALFEAFLFGPAQAEIGTGARVLQKGVADPVVFPQPGGPVISQVFCMARKRQTRASAGPGMGIILTMPDQMTLVSESSVEMGHVSPPSGVMVVSAAELCLFFARIVLSGAIRCLPRLSLIQILW